jgi:GNAT superfamily N-acetyltransferase
MNLSLVTERAAALELAPVLDRSAENAMREFRDSPLPAEVGRRLIERAFADPRFLLLVAREETELAGLLATAPFEDPLTGEALPMIVLLQVETPFRHRGLARALVLEARRLLARRGFSRLSARAAYNDDALISMGERFGFVRQWELLLNEA